MQYDKEQLNKLIADFTDREPLYEEFGIKIKDTIKKQLQSKVKDFICSSRPKDIKSFSEKIQRPNKNYKNPLADITDLTGVRFIVCYLDEIQAVVDIVENEFTIDKENSIDKSKLYKPDTFGYLSAHYIVTLNEEKKKKNEWKKFDGIKAEIQIRTQLQHSWALVSHTLYKDENDVPINLQRRLNRLAGLFELADQEFIGIKERHKRYVEETKEDFETDKTDKTEINSITINEFISRNQIVITAIKNARDCNLLIEDTPQKDHYNKLDSISVVELCKILEINTIKELFTIIDNNKINNKSFIKSISMFDFWKVTKPFILFLLLLKAKHSDVPKDFLIKKYGWQDKLVSKIIEQAKNNS